MKQEKKNENVAEGRFGQSIPDESCLKECRFITISAILSADKGIQHLGRDGPPGRARSPGINFIREWPPINLLFPESNKGKSNKKMNNYNLLQTKIQLFTNINYLKS